MLRRFFSSRFARILLWLFITLATLIVLLFVWTNWSGKRRWAATKALIEREGETLDFRKLSPETPPEKENLLAIEPLNGIAAVVDHDEKKGEPGAKRQALEALRIDAANSKAPAGAGVGLGEAADMKEWARHLRETKFLELPENSATPGRDVLQALDAKLPLLKQLSDETTKRTKAMFTPGLRERETPELLFSMQVPHYNKAQNLARMVSVRARAAVDAKDSGEATRSIVAACRIGTACESEPILIGFLVGITCETNALESLWAGLRERVLVEDDLRQLQRVFDAVKTEKSLLQAMRGEMAAGIGSLEFIQEAAAGRKESSVDFGALISNESNGLSGQSFRVLPTGLFDHWKSVAAEMELRSLIQPLKQGDIMAAVRASKKMESAIKEKSNVPLHADHIMARLMVPAVMTVNGMGLLTQTRNRQAVTAIALERFYLKHARYPARLEELAPDFLPAAPLDPCDGKALRYQTTADGRYKLWSVAFDGKDDAGKTGEKANDMKRVDYVGDWTWQYEPVN